MSRDRFSGDFPFPPSESLRARDGSFRDFSVVCLFRGDGSAGGDSPFLEFLDFAWCFICEVEEVVVAGVFLCLLFLLGFFSVEGVPASVVAVSTCDFIAAVASAASVAVRPPVAVVAVVDVVVVVVVVVVVTVVSVVAVVVFVFAVVDVPSSFPSFNVTPFELFDCNRQSDDFELRRLEFDFLRVELDFLKSV